MRMTAEFVGKVTEKELEESFQNIKNAYVSQAEEVFEKFGRYLKKNIFLIPPNVVLPEDKGKFEFHSVEIIYEKITLTLFWQKIREINIFTR